MRRVKVLAIVGCVASVLVSTVSTAQPVSEPRAAVAEHRSELERLKPENPAAYLELAEEIMAEAPSPTSRDLVVELLVRAYEFDRIDGGTAQTASSSALALASLPTSAASREWLAATAVRLDPRQQVPAWLRPERVEDEQANGYQIALAIGLVRAGQGGLAKQVLARPDVASSLAALDRTLSMMGMVGGADGLKREAARWPCRECGNERVVRRVAGGSAEYRVCPNCAGLPGPKLTPGELTAQLRIESLLLSGRQRSWAAQIATDGGSPLLDPDPASLAIMYRVDTSRNIFRGGVWVSDDAAEEVPGQSPAAPR